MNLLSCNTCNAEDRLSHPLLRDMHKKPETIPKCTLERDPNRRFRQEQTL